MNDKQLHEALTAELRTDVLLERKSATGIWNRARRDEIVDRYAREARSLRVVEQVFGAVELIALDVAAVALLLPAVGIAMAAIGTAVIHTAGTLTLATRA